MARDSVVARAAPAASIRGAPRVPKMNTEFSRMFRTTAAVLMAAGALTLLIFVPHWVWTGFLAVLMISVGFLMYRF